MIRQSNAAREWCDNRERNVRHGVRVIRLLCYKLQVADDGKKVCLIEHEVQKMRGGNCNTWGIDAKRYADMLKTTEIFRVSLDKIREIGSRLVSMARGTNSLYDDTTAHKYLHLCTKIITKVSVSNLKEIQKYQFPI